eukprot:snap_masked-scaffold_50-processed-gene-1.28-mRNA-1 protein AED:1.00 eAED:1.00 QI:0/0/0/0/1/1/3/0/329
MKKLLKCLLPKEKKNSMESVSLEWFRVRYENLTIDLQVKTTGVPLIEIYDTSSPVYSNFSANHRNRLRKLDSFEVVLFLTRTTISPNEIKFLESFFPIIDIKSIELFSLSSTMSTKGDLRKITFVQKKYQDIFLKNTRKKLNIEYIDFKGIDFDIPYAEVVKHYRLQGMNLKEIKSNINISLFYLCKYSIKHNIFPNLIHLNISDKSLVCDVQVSVLYSLAESLCNQLRVFKFSSRHTVSLTSANFYILSKVIISIRVYILLNINFPLQSDVNSTLIFSSLFFSRDFIKYKSFLRLTSGKAEVIKRANRVQSVSKGSFRVKFGKLTKEK